MRAFAENVLEAMQHMHSQGVIHTDIKLENILVASPEREDEYPLAKICDFGLCHVIDQSITAGPRFNKSYMKVKCGTHGYLAPEQKEVRNVMDNEFRIPGLVLKLTSGASVLCCTKWLWLTSQQPSWTSNMATVTCPSVSRTGESETSTLLI